MKRIGVVGIPENWSSMALADAIQEKTGFRLLIDMKEVRLDLETGTVWFQDTKLTDLDALIIKKIGETYAPFFLDRLEALKFIESRGVRIFSKPERIIRMLDRLSCTIKLREGNIPMPSTVVTEDIAQAENAVHEFGTAVLKPLYSTKARGMVILKPDNDLRENLCQFHADNPVMYIQRKIDIPGKDLGVTFLGGKYLATYARVAAGNSWNTTIHSGGRYEPYEPSDSLRELAEKAQSLFGLDFTCVDVVETMEGPMVFEVSAFGGFRGLQDAHNIAMANLYADYVLNQLNHDV